MIIADWHFGDYLISTNQALLSIHTIKELLEKTYWASERSVETIKKSIDNSICYGIYHQGDQVGFARVVTDYATMYWLCDVIIDENHRNKSLGKILLKCITETEELKSLRGMLATKDAHGLYQRFGFETVNGKFMARIP